MYANATMQQDESKPNAESPDYLDLPFILCRATPKPCAMKRWFDSFLTFLEVLIKLPYWLILFTLRGIVVLVRYLIRLIKKPQKRKYYWHRLAPQAECTRLHTLKAGIGVSEYPTAHSRFMRYFFVCSSARLYVGLDGAVARLAGS